METFTDKIKYVRDLAMEYLDLEYQLANQSLDEYIISQYNIRQEQIADELKEIF